MDIKLRIEHDMISSTYFVILFYRCEENHAVYDSFCSLGINNSQELIMAVINSTKRILLLQNNDDKFKKFLYLTKWKYKDLDFSAIYSNLETKCKEAFREPMSIDDIAKSKMENN